MDVRKIVTPVKTYCYACVSCSLVLASYTARINVSVLTGMMISYKIPSETNIIYSNTNVNNVILK
uniref:Uncharacterized protein n=1 Tax=Arundo donax TaxID=35708 RepID=A0A0A9E666_ARUDO